MTPDAQMQPLRRRFRATTATVVAMLGLLAGCTSSGETAEGGTPDEAAAATTTTENGGAATSAASETSDDGVDQTDEGADTTENADSTESDGSSDADAPTTTIADTAAEMTTTPKPTVQEQDSALACAQVEIGYLRLLNNGSGTEELLEGATSAQATGAATYIELGAALEAAIGSDAAADAADALLAQCEADGYERLV